jgi:GT2 family glycosyltransferase
VAWQGAHLLPACLDAVLPQADRVLVVDNASTDGTPELLARDYPTVDVLRLPTNTGFAGGVAAGLERVITDFVVLLNTDAVVHDDWLANLLEPLRRDPAVAAVSSKLVLPDGSVQSTGGWLEPSGYGHDRTVEADAGDVAYGNGAALALRTSVAQDLGMDPRFFLYYEDTDLSWRIWLAGHRVVFEPTAVGTHLHSASTGGSRNLLHTFYAERNRLATLVTCATPGLAVRSVLRFPLTTVSVALGESREKAWARTRAYASFLRWLPALLRRRRATVTRLSRQDFQARFMTPPLH